MNTRLTERDLDACSAERVAAFERAVRAQLTHGAMEPADGLTDSLCEQALSAQPAPAEACTEVEADAAASQAQRDALGQALWLAMLVCGALVAVGLLLTIFASARCAVC